MTPAAGAVYHPAVLRVWLAFTLALLGGCPTIELGETPVAPGSCNPDPSQFRETIWPLAIDPPDTAKSCVAQAACHAQETGRSAFRLISRPVDELTDADWNRNYDVVSRFLNCSTPEVSPFITKPRSDLDPHGGGDMWVCDATCEPIATVEAWILGS